MNEQEKVSGLVVEGVQKPEGSFAAAFEAVKNLEFPEVTRNEELSEHAKDAITKELDLLMTPEEQDTISSLLDLELGQKMDFALGMSPLPEGESIESICETFANDSRLALLGIGKRLSEFFQSQVCEELRQIEYNLRLAKRAAFESLGPAWEQVAEILKTQVSYQGLATDAIQSESTDKMFHFIYRELGTINLLGTFPEHAATPEDRFDYIRSLYLRDPEFDALVTHFSPFVSEENTPETQSEDITEEMILADEKVLAQLKTITNQTYEALEISRRYGGLSGTMEKEAAYNDVRTTAYRLALPIDRDNRSIIPFVRSNKALVHVLAEKGRTLIAEAKQRGLFPSNGEYQHPFKPDVLKQVDIEIKGIDLADSKKQFAIAPTSIDSLLSTKLFEHFGKFRNLFPARFLDGIASIEFHQPDSDETKYYQDWADSDPTASAFILMKYREKLTGVLIHEIFERVAIDMTVDEMMAFDRAIAADADKVSGVTWYSKYAQINADKGYSWQKEDFCETGKLYFTEPQKLYAVSPARYRFMLAFFANNLPEHVRPQYKKEMKEVITANRSKNIVTEKANREELTRHEKKSNKEFREKEGEPEKGVTAGEFKRADKTATSGAPTGHAIEIYVPYYLVRP